MSRRNRGKQLTAILLAIILVASCSSACGIQEKPAEERKLLMNETTISGSNKTFIEYKYDEYGRCIIKEEHRLSTSHDTEQEYSCETTKYYFNRQGILERETSVRSGEDSSTRTVETKYTYSSDGSLAKKEVTTTYEGSIFSPSTVTYEYEYENDGDHHSVTEKKTEHSLISYETTEYIGDNCIRVIRKDWDGNVTTEESLFDQWGNAIGRSNRNQISLLDRYETEIWTVRVDSTSGNGVFIFTEGPNCQYDQNNNLIYLSVNNHLEGSAKYHFTYDAQNRISSMVEILTFGGDLNDQDKYEGNWNYNEDGSFIVDRWGYSLEETGDWIPWYHIIEEFSVEQKPLRERYYHEGKKEYLGYEYIYDYSDSEEKVVKTFYDDTGAIEAEEIEISLYDEDGDLIMYEHKTSNGVIDSRHEYGYGSIEVKTS